MDLDRLNALPDEEAIRALLDCCSSTTWAGRVAGQRPFTTIDDLLSAARDEWGALDPVDREEAFASHPRIGARAAGDDRHTSWSRREQSGVDEADRRVLDELARCNRAYEERFDRVFLVFATGKTAADMLAMCRERLGNDPETEYEIASAEQEKITGLRLRRLVGID